MADERIRVVVEGDADDLRRALKNAARDLEGLNSEVKRASATDQKLARDVDQVARAHNNLRTSMRDLNQSFMAMRNIVSVLKFPALIAGLGAVTQVASGTAAGLTAVVGSLTNLTGAAAGAPIAFSMLGQSLLTVKLATADLTKAYGGNKQALQSLTPEARKFLQVMHSYDPLVKSMKEEAQKGLFPGLTKGMQEAAKNADVYRRIIGETGKELGNLGARAGTMIGSKQWGQDFATVGRDNVKIMDNLGGGALKLAGALRDITVTAEPVFIDLSKDAEAFAGHLADVVHHARETGELSKFFQDFEGTLKTTLAIVSNLSSALWSILRGGKPTGDSLLAQFQKTTKGWADFLKSTQGRSDIARVFREAEPVIQQVAGLISDITKGLFRIGTSPGAETMLASLRKMIPMLTTVVQSTTAAFGPPLVAFLAQAVKTLGFLAGSSGPLVLFVKGLTEALKVVNALLNAIPGLKPIIVTLAGTASLYKALGIAETLLGLGRIKALLGAVGVTTAVKSAATGVVARTTGAAVGGAAAGGTAAAGGGVLGGGVIGTALAATSVTTLVPVMIAGIGAAALGGLALAIVHASHQALAKSDYTGGQITGPQRQPTSADVSAWSRGIASPEKVKAMGSAMENFNRKLKDLGPLSQASAKDLQSMIDQAGDLAQKFPNLASGLDKFADAAENALGKRVKGVVDDMASAFGILSKKTGESIANIRQTVTANTGIIKLRLGTDTVAGRDAMAKNFQLAADAVRKSMKDGVTTTAAGTAEIHRLMVKALEAYGLDAGQAEAKLSTGTMQGAGAHSTLGQSGEGVRKALGGFIGAEGQAGTDQRHVIVGDGEAVLTRHQQAFADNALQATYGMSLGDLFQKVQQPHWAARGLLTGQLNEPVLDSRLQRMASAKGVAIFVESGRRTLAEQAALYARYKAGTGNIAAPPNANAPHVRGIAADIRPGREVFGQIAAQFGLGFPVPGESWHVQLLDAGASGGSAATVNVKAPGVTGGGGVGAQISAGLSKVASAGNAKANQILAAMIGDGGSGGATGGYTKAQLMRLWIAAGGPASQANTAAAIALAESGGNPNAVNHNKDGSIDRGLWQINSVHGALSTFGVQANARAAVQLFKARHGFGDWVTYNDGAYKTYAARGLKAKKPPKGKRMTAWTTPDQATKMHTWQTTAQQLAAHSAIHPPSMAEVIADVAGSLWRHEQQYDIDSRRYDQTDEQPTKTLNLPIPAGSLDAALVGVNPTDAAWVRANNAAAVTGDTAEVRDMAAISAHIAELDALYHAKQVIRLIAGNQHVLVQGMLRALAAEIATVSKQIHDMLDKIKHNREHLKELNERLSALRKQRSKAKGKEAKDLDKRIQATGTEISHVNTDYGKYTGELSKLRGRLTTLKSQQGTYEDGQGGKGWEFDDQSLALDLGDIAKEKAQWITYGGTAPTNALSNVAAAATGGDVVQAAAKQAMIDAAQFGLLAGMMQVVAPRFIGSFAHGTDEVAQTGYALVHAGERITPAADGPYGSQLVSSGGANVEVHVHGDAAPLMRHVEVMVDGKVQRANVVTARAARLIGAGRA